MKKMNSKNSQMLKMLWGIAFILFFSAGLISRGYGQGSALDGKINYVYTFDDQNDGDTVVLDANIDNDTVWNALIFNSHLSHDSANAANPLNLPEAGHGTFVTGMYGEGKAMSFNGSSDWVLLQNKYDGTYPEGVPPFGVSCNNLSAVAWINPEATTVAPPNVPEQFILHIGHGNGVAMMIKNDTLWAGVAVRDRVDGKYNDDIILKAPFTAAGKWSMVAVVFEGQAINDTTSFASLYINGTLVDTARVQGDKLYSSYFSSAAIGAEYSWNPLGPVATYTPDGVTTCYFKGLMDEVRISKTAYNAWDIKNLYLEKKKDYVYTFDAQQDGDSIILDADNVIPFNVKFIEGGTEDSPLGHITLADDNLGGKALQLNGSNQFILVQGKYENYPAGAEPFGLKMTELSATAWINPEKTSVNPPKSPSQTIIKIGHGNGIALNLKNDTLWAAVAARDRYEGSGFEKNMIISAPFTAAGEWSLVGVSFKGDTTTGKGLLELYVNGQVAASAEFDTCVLFRSAFTNTTIGSYMSWGPFGDDIGYLDDHIAGHFFKGLLGEVKISKKALSAWDMKNMYLKNKINYVYNFDAQQDGDSIILDADNVIPFNVKFIEGGTEDSPLGHITLADDNLGGKALQLNGSNQFILVQGKYENYPAGAEPFGLKMTELSATAWINPEKTSVNPPKSPSQTIIKIGHGNGIALNLKNDTLWAAVAARDRYEGSGFEKNMIISAPFTAAGEWSLVGVSFKGDTTTGKGLLELYVNGQVAASAEFDTCVLFRSAFTNTTIGSYMSWGPFGDDIGYLDDHIAGHFFKGLLGEVKISKKALDPNSQRKDYLLGLDVPAVYYNFDEQVDGDSIVIDSLGNWNAKVFNSHLTHDEANAANPLVLPSLGHGTFVEGLGGDGKAMQFNGSSDWVLVQNKYDGYYPDGVPPFGDAYEDLTARVWINPEMTTVSPPKSPDQFILHVGHSNGVAIMIKNDTLWAGAAVRNRAGGNDPNDNVILKAPFDKAGVWSQVAVVFDGKAAGDTASVAYLYINGEVADTAVVDGDMIYSSYFSSTVLGAEYSWNPLGPVALYTPDGETTSFFKGLMDNVLITKSAISKEDMLADYQANNPSAIHEVDKWEHIKVYPNPTRGIVYVDLKERGEPVTVEVMNMTGMVVLAEKIGIPYGKEQISLSGLNNGLYIIRVTSGNKVYTAKVQLVK